MSKATRFLFLLPALGIYAWITYLLNFTQDDAYITYRFVQNFLNGDGLVWNIGERVEGITNFGWAVYLALWGGLGADYVLISKLTGFLCGAGAIVITYLITSRLFEVDQPWFALLAPYMVAINFAFAYWSPAGLETAAFAFVALLAVYLYLLRNPFLIAALAVSVLIRPEGGLLAVLLVAVDWLLCRRLWGFALRCGVVAFILSVPFVAFKLGYYGSVLPNPFFAKTGSSFEQLQSGLQYTWQYLLHYGLAGSTVLILALFFKQLSWQVRVVLALYLGYLLYIAVVGGDVLPVHRFFLPVFGLNAALAAVSIWILVKRADPPVRYTALVVIALGIGAVTILVPYDMVKRFNHYEKGFTDKMQFLADRMKESNPANFSVALPTIGVFGYTLMGHDIIDMVGLTDSTIARHSEPPVEGMQTTWKERNYNSPYLLTRAPDYVVFSTSMKPSAPAERALLLYPQFLEAYRMQTWTYQHPVYSPTGVNIGAFRKVRDIHGPVGRQYPLAWVNEYKAALEEYSDQKYLNAIRIIEESRRDPRTPLYPELLFLQGLLYASMSKQELSVMLLDSAILLDSLVEGPHKTLYFLESIVGNSEKARIHREYLGRMSPWEATRMDTVIAKQMGRP